jgi:hypothetical protein
MYLRTAALMAMVAAGLVLVTSAGAGSATVAVPRVPDLSTTAKIKSYLLSLGINPKSVVIQRGKKNYAGPHCPGKGWACANRTRVLQVGSENFFECTGGTGTGETGGTQTCAGTGVQVGGKNTFRCIERTSAEPASQRCTVDQSGERNYALIEQVVDQASNTDDEQDATQIAEVHQNGAGLTPQNELHVFQRVKQSLTTTGSQKQDAHQVVRPAGTFTNIQDATTAGNNFSEIHEYIDQRGSGAATSQEQNTEALPTDPEVTDCVVTTVFPIGPTTPNQCVEGSQSTGAGGQNQSQIHQLIDQDAKSSDMANPQAQGHSTGGIDARVHQTVGGATGSSNSQAHQAMRQNVAGALGSTQFQIDPTSCCGVSQEGGMGNLQKIHEGSSQHSDGNTAEQELTLIGQCNTANGSCFVTHQARNDEDHANYECGSTNDPCPPVSITECESTEVVEGTGRCTTPDDFTEFTLADPIFTETSLLPGTPLSGFEVTMGLVEPDLSVLPLLR